MDAAVDRAHRIVGFSDSLTRKRIHSLAMLCNLAMGVALLAFVAGMTCLSEINCDLADFMDISPLTDPHDKKTVENYCYHGDRMFFENCSFYITPDMGKDLRRVKPIIARMGLTMCNIDNKTGTVIPFSWARMNLIRQGKHETFRNYREEDSKGYGLLDYKMKGLVQLTYISGIHIGIGLTGGILVLGALASMFLEGDFLQRLAEPFGSMSVSSPEFSEFIALRKDYFSSCRCEFLWFLLRYYLALVCLAGSALAAPFAFDLATDGLFLSYWPRYMDYWARFQSMTDPDGWYIRWPVKGHIPRPESFMFPRRAFCRYDWIGRQSSEYSAFATCEIRANLWMSNVVLPAYIGFAIVWLINSWTVLKEMARLFFFCCVHRIQLRSMVLPAAKDCASIVAKSSKCFVDTMILIMLGKRISAEKMTFLVRAMARSAGRSGNGRQGNNKRMGCLASLCCCFGCLPGALSVLKTCLKSLCCCLGCLPGVSAFLKKCFRRREHRFNEPINPGDEDEGPGDVVDDNDFWELV